MKRKIVQVLAMALICFTACNETQDQTKGRLRKEKAATAELGGKSKPEKPNPKRKGSEKLKRGMLKFNK